MLYLIWKNPWMTVSRDTYVSAMLATVGWKTLPMQAEKRYPEIAADDKASGVTLIACFVHRAYLFDDGHIAALRDDLHLQQPIRLIDGEMTSWVRRAGNCRAPSTSLICDADTSNFQPRPRCAGFPLPETVKVDTAN